MSRDFMAPGLAVKVGDSLLGADITSAVISAEFEDTSDMVSKVSVTLDNRGMRFSDAQVFQPGNEVSLYMGYGPELAFIGRGEIVRHRPGFPREEAPALTIVGYDRSFRMMKEEMEIKGGGGEAPEKKKDESGRLWKGTLKECVTALFSKYGIKPLVEESIASIQVKFTQKKGTSDYKVLRALANLYGCETYTRWNDETKEWEGHFRAAINGKSNQSEFYTFRYAQGEASSLLEIDLDYSISETVTEVQAWVWDRGANGGEGDWLPLVEEEKEKGKKEKFSAGTFGDTAFPGGQVDPLQFPTRLKLSASGHAVEILTRRFRDPVEAQIYVKLWLNAYKDSFVEATGTVIGIETLRAGQVHVLEGLGARFSGEYYWSMARHSWKPSEGYEVEFTARKVVE